MGKQYVAITIDNSHEDFSDSKIPHCDDIYDNVYFVGVFDVVNFARANFMGNCTYEQGTIFTNCNLSNCPARPPAEYIGANCNTKDSVI
jgi:hypothetical protein